jgi:hypothetical protein
MGSEPLATHQDLVEHQLRNEATSVETWLLGIYVNELGLSEKASHKLIAAGADHHEVEKALKHGATEKQVVKIFA